MFGASTAYPAPAPVAATTVDDRSGCDHHHDRFHGIDPRYDAFRQLNMRPVVILLPASVLCIATDPARAQSQPATAAWALAGRTARLRFESGNGPALDGRQVKAAGEQQSRQSFVGAVNSQAGADRIATARATYGADTGQGYGVCATPVALESRSLAEKSSVDVAAAYAAADRTWLANGGDAVERAAGLQDARKELLLHGRGARRHRLVPTENTERHPSGRHETRRSS